MMWIFSNKRTQDVSNLLYLEKFSFLWFSFDTELRRRWSHSGIGTKRLFWPVTVSTASISRISRIIVTGQNKFAASPKFIASSASWYFHYYSYQAIVNVLLWCSQSWIIHLIGHSYDGHNFHAEDLCANDYVREKNYPWH